MKLRYFFVCAALSVVAAVTIGWSIWTATAIAQDDVTIPATPVDSQLPVASSNVEQAARGPADAKAPDFVLGAPGIKSSQPVAQPKVNSSL